ncbi:MAG: hypothetical protein ACXVFN_23480, partial [Solirubrobacteraceae bacterium]
RLRSRDMTKSRLAALGAALVALGAAAAPAHAAWHVTTITGSESFLRGVDARPDRVPLILDERVSHGTSTLELRVGSKAPQRIAVAQHTFGDVRIDHDDRGAPVVAWDNVTHSGGSRQLFVWSAAGGTQQLTTGTQSTSLQSLDVAGDGGAVLAGWSRAGLVVARRAPGAQAFGAAATLATDVDLGSSVAAAPFGSAVVAWSVAGQLRVAATDGTSVFGAAQAVVLPPAPDGRTPFVDGVAMAATPAGDFVIAASTIPDHEGARSAGRRVDVFDWALGTAPSAARTISQAPFAGAPAVIARGETAFVAWTETTAANVSPHTMRVARFGPSGVASTTTYTNSDHNLGSVAGIPVLQALPGTAVRVYYRPSRSARTYTVTFDENGRARGAALVAERTNADIAGALARNGSLLAWTRRLGTTNSSYRVQTATP